MSKEEPFSINGSLVKNHVHQWSYNLTNRQDAVHLHRVLNELYSEKNNLDELDVIKHKLSLIESTLNEVYDLLQLKQ